MALDKEMPGENFNTEDFITEIEKWPTIWDLGHDDYSNKIAKENAWESTIGKFVPNFTDMSTAEKNSIATSYQRKWKSLRDSYTRERSKQKKEGKSGSAKKYRKKYVFFEQLRFLETATKSTEDSLAVSDEDENGEDARMEEVAENPTNDRKQGNAKEKKRRNKADQNEELLEIIKAKYLRQEIGEAKDDDDKLFLLSLHHDLKTLPDHVKLNVKSQMIGVLSSAKQAAFTSVTPAAQQFSSPLYQYQQPPSTYPQQQVPQSSSFHQLQIFNRAPIVPPNQENDRPYYPPLQSPNETASNTSDISDLYSEG